MADLSAPTLLARLTQRVAERDNPSPPPPPSQEPAAVAARLDAWLQHRHGVRDVRGRHALTQMLLVLLDAPDGATAALGTAAGVGPRAAARHVRRLEALGLTSWHYRGRTCYHCLLPTTEDALLAVVRGE